MIKNLENLKKYNIICTNTNEVEECFYILEKLGFDIYYETYNNIDYRNIFISYSSYAKKFMSTDLLLKEYKNINFYNFKKQTKKFLKEKEKQLPDFEVAEDGMITKINNYESDKRVYLIDAGDVNCADEEYIFNFKPDFLKNYCKYGLIFSTKEVRDKMLEKQEIYIKLKNLAERLNNGENIDWNDIDEDKYYIYYDYANEELRKECNNVWMKQGTIYCLDENFLEIAIKEIGEENLLKLFED